MEALGLLFLWYLHLWSSDHSDLFLPGKDDRIHFWDWTGILFTLSNVAAGRLHLQFNVEFRAGICHIHRGEEWEMHVKYPHCIQCGISDF
jgi:hypothetical protein